MITTSRLLETVDGRTQLSRFGDAYQRSSDRILRRVTWFPSTRRYNLTVADEPAFVWFRVAKVGTRTIFRHLERCGVPLIAAHAWNVRYPPAGLPDHFKFAFVRNPWDRLVSCWIDKVVTSNHFGFDEPTLERMQVFEQFVDHVAGLDLDTCDPHVRRQSRLIDLNALDFLGRHERFEHDMELVFGRLGLPFERGVRENASADRRPYSCYYDDQLVATVAGLYRTDVQLFGYEFG